MKLTTSAKLKEGEAPDYTLLARIAAGDEEAFAILVRRYGNRFYGVARRMLGNEGDAEDAVQATFLRVYRHAGAYRTEWSSSTWLYRILTNTCIDAWRKRRQRAEVSESADNTTVAPHDAQRLDVERALAKLPAEARAILLLCYVEDLSYAEVARARGITVNTVKTQLLRAKRLMRKYLNEEKR